MWWKSGEIYLNIELQQIGLFVQKKGSDECSYVNITKCGELVGISPTVTNCSNNVQVMKNACVCYGSQIIPQGVTSKSTKREDDSVIYPIKNDQLGIEIEHIAYFLQMMLFGGSCTPTWKEFIDIIYEEPPYNTTAFREYIDDGFTDVDRSRKYLYGISTKIFKTI